MNRRGFFKGVLAVAPLVFVPKLISPVWKRTESGLYAGEWRSDISPWSGKPLAYDDFTKIMTELQRMSLLPESIFIPSKNMRNLDMLSMGVVWELS